ncbi:hypothetical protein GOP47_0008222 [Adiantum capillus-veneris]|uniref:Protein kinase domain-containing protein n=1 Tax=Adiantum capillus-veneris TaxID=13818 RepID=A0A9D4UYM4_ADICA|nr:hypothetical protein GOP47_0008222 [Adiantum capillus-veneris]
MEILQEENGKYATRTLSDGAAASSSGAKIAKLPGGHSLFNPSFTSCKDMGYRKVKFMCSSAGKILPRPSDMKLRYVGGETRMVSLPRNIQYEAFYGKMVELYGRDIILKYQLPEEDLDALVSVSSDEDLENMMEECDRLSAGEGLSKLRVFVFVASELDVHDLDDIANFKSSERKFVDAINAVSGDAMPGMPSTAKLHTNSDSFNDAYKLWNGIHSQDKGSLFSKNPYSEVLPLEDYVSSGDLCTHESFVPGQLQSSTSPFSHSAFMGQPLLSSALAIQDVFKEDSGSVGWKDSRSFFGQGVGHSYGSKNWVTSSEMPVQKISTIDDNREDRKYKIEQSFGEPSREMNGSVQTAQDVLAYDRKLDKASLVEQASAPEPAMSQVGAESPLKKVESADNIKCSIGHSHSDPLDLSPGAFLQKQLMSSPSAATPSLKQLHSDWPSDQFLDADNRQSYSMASGLENQEQIFGQHMVQDQWEKLPVYDSSLGFEGENRVLGHIDDQSLGMQPSTTAEVPPFSRESSAAIFPANSAPSSPPGWKLQSDRGCQNVPQHDNSFMASLSSFPSQTSTALLGPLAQISANIIPSAKFIGEKLPMNLTSTQDQALTQDFGNLNSMISVEEPYAFSSSQRVDQEAVMDRVQIMMKPLNFFPDAASEPVSPDERIRQPLALPSDEDTNQFLFSVQRGQSPEFTLSKERLVSYQLDTTAIRQHENEKFDGFSHFEEVSPPAMIDSSHRLDMLSDLLSSSRLTECLAAPSSTGESFRSRSACSVDEEPHQQEGEKAIAMAGKEFAAGESLDFPLSTLGNSHFPSFETNQNSLPSNEQFDRVPAFTSLIETWEATLLQDEDEQQTMEHGMHEHVQEQIDISPTFDKEIGLEGSRVEFEEVEEFQSFDYGPMNAAAIAEKEAISRGLQIIRNCDLEELRELGSGTFGTVYHGKWRGTDVAIKRIKASCFAGRQAERDRLVADFWREAYILGQLHHPNVVAFYGVVPDGPGGTLATVTEYMVNGSLKQVLQNKDRTLDRRKRLLIAMDAAFGMEYLHGKNVVHFDIKCENLLVNLRDTQRPICKVGDLGLSKVKQQTFVSGGVRGTLPWMAPELLNGSSSLVSEKVDVFSFGIVMWELLTGEEPYANMHYGAIIGGIVNNTLRPTVPRWCDAAWRSLMEKCWAADPGDRPTFLEIARALRAMEASLAAKAPGQARILDMYQ